MTLFFSAFPAKLYPKALLPLRTISNDILALPGTQGGRAVFNIWRDKYKQRFICLTVEGVRADASKEILYRSHENCEAPKFRVIENVLDRALIRILIVAFLKDKSFDMATRQVQRSRRLTRIAKYFCYSKQVDNESIEKVYFTWFLRAQNYQSGEMREHTGFAHGYDCRKGRRIIEKRPVL